MADRETRLIERIAQRVERRLTEQAGLTSPANPMDRSTPSRRNMLQALGAGTAGFGMLGMTSLASAAPAEDSRISDGAIIAEPGKVQQAIDTAAARADHGWEDWRYVTVRLVSGNKYSPDRTWQVKPGVILDFNGAILKPAHAGDVIHQFPRSKLIRPFIDSRKTPFKDAAMIRQDTGLNNGNATGQNACQIFDCRLIDATRQTGTIGLHVIDSAAKGMGGGATVSGLITNLDRSVVLQADSDHRAFVNTYLCQLKITNYLVGVEHLPGAGATNGHYFVIDTQPCNNKGYRSQWLWKLNGGCRFNTMVAMVWDSRMYEDGTVMWIDKVGHSNYNNCLVDTFQFTGDWQCVGPGKGGAGNGIFRWLDGFTKRPPK